MRKTSSITVKDQNISLIASNSTYLFVGEQDVLGKFIEILPSDIQTDCFCRSSLAMTMHLDKGLGKNDPANFTSVKFAGSFFPALSIEYRHCEGADSYHLSELNIFRQPKQSVLILQKTANHK